MNDFKPGDIVRIVDNYEDDDSFSGMVGVVVFMEDSPPLCVNIRHPDQRGTIIFPEPVDIKHWDCEDPELLLFSHCVKMEDFYKVASDCKHDHWDKLDRDDFKCIDCGLKTESMNITNGLYTFIKERIVE